MKDKILEILDDRLEAYADQEQGFVKEKSVMLAAEELTQLMCDELTGEKFRYFGNLSGWERDIINELQREGFTKEQVDKSMVKLK